MYKTTFIMKNKIKNKPQLKTIQKRQTQKYLRKKKKRKILPQEQVEISEHRESSPLRNQPQKNYKTFIPQSKILKKLEFQNNFDFKN